MLSPDHDPASLHFSARHLERIALDALDMQDIDALEAVVLAHGDMHIALVW